jgi:tetratricopeptide (TPR) repeat protein
MPVKEQACTNEFLKALKQYKAGDLRRLQAIIKLAQIRYQMLEFPEAERMYRLVLAEIKLTGDYNPEIPQVTDALAEVLTAERNLDEARVNYQAVLKYDQEHLPKADLNIARDLNNLGLNAYLQALSMERGEPRNYKLKQAHSFFNQALAIYRTQPQSPRSIQGLSVCLYNDHLALRDLDDQRGADSDLKQSLTLEAQFKRQCSLP